jgi:hypothetical protein
MFLIFDLETGAELRRGDVETVETGEGIVKMPGSALTEPPLTIWSPAERGFMDVPLVDGPALLTLLTQAEIVAATANPTTIPVVLQWQLLIGGGQAQRVNSPLHIAGANALLAAGVLTQARHAQFLAGEPAQ